MKGEGDPVYERERWKAADRESRAAMPKGWQPQHAPLVDRTTDRWKRIRLALCEHNGLPCTLNEHTDRIVLMIERSQ
jgi:hypothetical protein